MPPSKPSRLPSKKRRASSASGSVDETVAKEASIQTEANNQTKEKVEPAADNHHAAYTAKNKISPSRLPSKKRKSSHDSSHQSVQSGSGNTDENSSIVKDSKENEQKGGTNEPNADSQIQQHSTETKILLKKPPSASDGASEDKCLEQRSRKHSVDNLGADRLRQASSDSPSSSPARLRLRSTSQGSLDSPNRTRLRSGSHTSLDFLPKARLRSGSQASLDSLPRTRLRSGSHNSLDSTARRLRSGSTTSIDDPFFRRKYSEDMSALDIFGPQRKESQDTTRSIKLDVLMDLPPPEPININPKIGEFEMDGERPRSNSTASLVHEGPSAGGGALEHLDALGDDAKPAAKKRRDSAEGDDNSSSADTFASAGHRVLMEAIKLSSGDADLASKESSQDVSLQPRGRLESWGGGGRERFESLGSVFDAAAFASRGRDRLESWGGMSDLSINFGASTGGSSSDRGGMSSAAAAAAAAAAAVAEQFELAGNGEDFAGLGLFDEQGRQRTSSIPSRISLERDRFNSIASFSEASFFPDGAEVTIDLNSIVAAAMAHVGDLAELAGIVENVAAAGSEEGKEADASESSSVASPLIGALAEGGGHSDRQRPRSWSTSSKLSVDYEALAAAVDAAQAAAGNIDLDSLGIGRLDDGSSTEGKSRKDKNGRRWRRQLPLKRDRTASETSEEERAVAAQVSEKEMDRIRKRARMAAAGRAPSPENETPSSSRKKQSIPIKKRVKRQNSSTPQPEGQVSAASPVATPRVSNIAIAAADEAPDIPMSSVEKSTSKGQASQKWDSMFDALLAYIEERRQEETVDFSEEEKKEWIWDGNVPTTYKTSDGKALGRWVNNQRSAKSKGTLKPDREERLVQAGLKWSVLASNSWNETLEELRNYIKEQTKDGKEWDGNVPTHYQIKAKPNGKFAGEDKNLGRWVNRQRSLYQAGRLRKDRQMALEKLGLKWSMLASTTWEAMFETLQEYVAERKKKEGSWDGNVPANFRTTDNPPRALGRWINRQRSAFTKGKLKAEYVEKLNDIGLKWSVHDKNGSIVRTSNSDDGDDSGAEEETTPVKSAPEPEKIVKAEEKEEEKKEDVVVPPEPVSSAATVEEAAALSEVKQPFQTPLSA